jgi:glutamate synthase (ferredoxin)
MPVSARPAITNYISEKDACGTGFIFRRKASHQVLADTLQAITRLDHRGACGADCDTGDGAGVLTAIPWDLLENAGYHRRQHQAVAVFYLPIDQSEHCKKIIEEKLQARGFNHLVWRRVPTRPEFLGPLAKSTLPQVEQLLVALPTGSTEASVEQTISSARKELTNHFRDTLAIRDFYVASFSTRTIVYKAMVRGPVLAQFYPDLVDPVFQSNWAVYHRRFSTNTLPRWALAQPFRLLAHNGEINTLLGNLNWMKARQPVIARSLPSTMQDYYPLIDPNGSDSANLDDTLELLLRMGHSLESALMQLIPEAFNSSQTRPLAPTTALYQYYAALQEPWDGPALIVFGDGKTVGATLDRNGLRPARYTLMADGSVVFGSETGIVDLPIEDVLERGRLGPGQMLSVDLESGTLRKNAEIKETVAKQYPFADWLASERRTLPRQPFAPAPTMPAAELLANQQALGYGKEDVDAVIATMANTGAETVFSMGDDTPLAVLSQQPKTVYEYFKQKFAQVTNPPIDHLREKSVMSIDVHLGRRNHLFMPNRAGACTLQLESPFLNEAELDTLLAGSDPFQAERLSLLFKFTEPESFDRALRELCLNAEAAIAAGKSILVLSDRGLSSATLAIPPLLAVGALHHHLIRKGLRLECSLVVETGQCWNVHHYACLLGFGAQAICPYLVLETIRQKSEPAASTSEQLLQHYRQAVEEGLQKVISKMGISVLSSYVGAQIFECVGLGPKIIQDCFEGTVSRIGGLEMEEIARDLLRFHRNAYPQPIDRLTNYGVMNHRVNGEFHGNNPQLVRTLHKALGFKNDENNDIEKHKQFHEYTRLVRSRPPAALRDLLTFASDRQPIPIADVEPLENIVRRFCTGGMSLGALSKEAHEVLAIAMNRLKGKSNSGEGGEDPLRYYPIRSITPAGTSPDFPGLTDLKAGDSAGSAIRQVASARFGVTTEYLVTARQLEIKIAQGAKPGEGGQLPGHKVSEYIAKLRLAKPGIPLISPPPHHDIYSIEDLAQLIFDLRRVNPIAEISVKLVSENGIGTVAAGVAKTDADIIQISGHDGGTGASPLTSIKNAGLPWELGLAEVQQALLANQLRDQVLLRVDGGLRTGWDIVTAALLGADEYGFGSIALIAGGCIMARICHTNNCPVGITSQKENLRKRFRGSPKTVMEFFLFLAEEVRHILAQLGYRNLAEVIGRTDLLRQRTDIDLPKPVALDMSCLINTGPTSNNAQLPKTKKRNNNGLDEALLADPEVAKAISKNGSITKSLSISNTDRTVGARLSGAIASQYGDHGFAGQITINLTGTAGQSFGAFNVTNLRLILTGDTNDYVGKGMTGGEIILKPEPEARYLAENNTIAGNTCLYGATGGALYAAGQVGERFAVRNSRAVAVIEGAGDHCCEYMTGGIVVVLGKVGRNFGAGMTGGVAYILDENDLFKDCFNADCDKELRAVTDQNCSALKALVETHQRYTGSKRAGQILANWSEYLPRFKQVLPPKEEANPTWPFAEATDRPDFAGAALRSASGQKDLAPCEPVVLNHEFEPEAQSKLA